MASKGNVPVAPAIPFITPKDDKNLYDFMSAVKQWIEIRDGRRGNEENRFVELKEVKVRVDTGVQTAVSISGTSGSTTTDSTPPASASGLTLISYGMGGVEIGWTPPADTDVSQYIIYGDVVSSFNVSSTPVQGVVAAPATRFSHKWTHPLSTAYTWYYWVVVVDKSGNKSSVLGPLTVNASTSYDRAIEKVVSSILDNENADIAFKTNKIKIAPQDGTTAGTVYPFGIGTIDGVTAVCLRGDLFVDGSINGKVITAGTIYGDKINAGSLITLKTGGVLRIGESDVELASDASGSVGNGRIRVWDKTEGGNNRSLFWRGAFSHYNDVDGDTICQVPPRQMSLGYGIHGTMVEINGEFPFVPTVMCSPSLIRMNTYAPYYAAIAHPGPVTKTGADAGRYQFRMYSISCYMNLVFMVHNFSRVYATFSYPTLPADLWWPGSHSSQYQQMTTVAGGISKLFVQIMFRAKTNSGYGIRGNFQLQVGYVSGGFVVTDTADNAYESYVDQEWRSVWILCTPSTTGRQYAKVKFTPTNWIPSRYEGIGNRIEYYISTAVVYSDGWDAAYSQGSGSYIAYT